MLRTPEIKDEARVKADSQFMNYLKRSFKMPALIEITVYYSTKDDEFQSTYQLFLGREHTL